MTKYTLLLVGLIVALLAWLVYEASLSNGIAIFILGLLTAGLLIGLGFGVSLVQASIAAKRQEANFAANVKENLAYMAQVQAIQNQQNSQLLKQLKQLPDKTQDEATIIIDEGLFSEFEE